jgi:subtilisin family serine protease
VAADTNNDVGVSGVAGGDGSPDSGAKLMVSVGFGQTSTGGFAEALVYGADNGAQISSNSWGYISSGVVEQAVLDAIDYYTDSSADGGEGIEGIVVFAAGNDNSNADYYPGFYEKTVAVAATDNGGTRASFSNYGDWIDISAPGVSILSTIIGGYDWYSGTSMACPHVAGILALCLSVDPGLGRQDVLDRLYATADPLTADLGAGMADAEAFVAQCANGAPSPKPTVSMRPTTAVPTPKPTVSVAPTRSCACEQALTITVVTVRGGVREPT